MAPFVVEVLARLALSALALLLGWVLVGWGKHAQGAEAARAASELGRLRESERALPDDVAAGEPASGLADESTVVLLSQVPGDWRELDDA